MQQSTIAEKDIALIKSIAQRMSNPDLVKQTVLDPNNKNPDPFSEMSKWDDLSIAGGYSGVLPLFVELDRISPEERWDLIAHDYVLKIVNSIQTNSIRSLTLFSGLAGTCYYVRQASRNGERYQKMLDKMDDFLLKGISSTHFSPFDSQLSQSIPRDPSYYEAIQGLSGVGIYALTMREKPPFKECVDEIIRRFISLTKTIEVKGKRVPGWYSSPESFFLDSERESCPNGNFNLGLSHGIPGVLAFLSIAMLQNVELEGQKEEIETIARWLMDKRKSIDGRFFWDSRVTFEEEISGKPLVTHKSRDAWCYGTPGVARTLYLAGHALKSDSIKEFALESFISIFKSTREEWNLPGPTMCHGIAGLLIITQLMARDSGSSFLEDEVKKLREILLSHYDSSFPFGFRDAEPHKNSRNKYAWIDRGDILEGVSGVLLTLLSLHTENYSWHRPFLIDA